MDLKTFKKYHTQYTVLLVDRGPSNEGGPTRTRVKVGQKLIGTDGLFPPH